MTQSAAVWWVLLFAVVAANLPFLNERLLLIGPSHRPAKAFGWRLLELVVWGAVTLGMGVALESSLGQRAEQGWEFYAAAAFLFVTLAFPGFIWRYLRRGRGGQV